MIYLNCILLIFLFFPSHAVCRKGGCAATQSPAVENTPKLPCTISVSGINMSGDIDNSYHLYLHECLTDTQDYINVFWSSNCSQCFTLLVISQSLIGWFHSQLQQGNLIGLNSFWKHFEQLEGQTNTPGERDMLKPGLLELGWIIPPLLWVSWLSPRRSKPFMSI